MWDPHVKAFLLLQAYMSRIDLPISDYVGDQNSVLDQSIRIVQASIDVLTELGYLSSCLTMITLLQCIKSARWPDDGPLSILPGVEVAKEQHRMPTTNLFPKSLTDLGSMTQKAIQSTMTHLNVPNTSTPNSTKPQLCFPPSNSPSQIPQP
jgi:antiviral helicase SLH1